MYRYEVSFEGDKNVPKLDGGDGCITMFRAMLSRFSLV